jgi:hypothetical protein
MALDADQLAAVTRYLKRVKTEAEIKLIADQAFADLQSGKTVTSVTFEGGGTTAVVNCNPSILLAACEQVLFDAGSADAVAPPPSSQSIFQQFSTTLLQT